MPDLINQFSHIYWVGGSPCSGKTSTAKLLAERFGLCYYSCDDAFFRHARAVTAEAQPTFYRAVHYSSEELWMRPAGVQAVDEMAIYGEEFGLILEDLLAMPADQPILAEGAALLPELTAPLMLSLRRGFWMVPTPAFQQHHYAQREWARDVVRDCSDPEQAFQNWMHRDILFAEGVRQQAQQQGLRVLVVDGQQTIEETVLMLQDHFGLAE